VGVARTKRSQFRKSANALRVHSDGEGNVRADAQAAFRTIYRHTDLREKIEDLLESFAHWSGSSARDARCVEQVVDQALERNYLTMDECKEVSPPSSNVVPPAR